MKIDRKLQCIGMSGFGDMPVARYGDRHRSENPVIESCRIVAMISFRAVIAAPSS
jgi:hypothetical protein